MSEFGTFLREFMSEFGTFLKKSSTNTYKEGNRLNFPESIADFVICIWEDG